jgi:hypothetical protein
MILAMRECSTACISVVGGAGFLNGSAYSMRKRSATRMMNSACGLPGRGEDLAISLHQELV